MSKPEPSSMSRAEIRRSAILAVAWKAFLEHGYAGASMSEIAERLGGSKGTLYNYFSSKEELFLAAAHEKGEELRAELSKVSPHSDDLTDDLTRLACELLDIVKSDDYLAFYRIIIAEAVRLPIIGEAAYADRQATLLSPLAARIEEEIKIGRLRKVDPMEAADVFWDLCSASFHWRSLLGLSSELTAKEIRRLVERGVWIFLSAYGLPEARSQAVSGRSDVKHFRAAGSAT